LGFRDGPRFIAQKSHYVRSAIHKAQRFPDVPRITPAQAATFDKLDELAASPELRPGDIQFLCNHWTFHSRTRFEDWPEPERRRHLLRLWLGCPDGPEVPEWFIAHQGPVRPTRRHPWARLPAQPLHSRPSTAPAIRRSG
jgi:Taurine catabolism dioxygenase TauD, TfdA family